MATFTYSNTLFEHGRSVIITAPAGKLMTSLFYQQLDAQDFVQTKYFSPFVSEHRLTQLEAGDYSALIKYDDSTQEQVQFAGQAVPTQPKIEKVASTETTCRVLVSRLDASAEAYQEGMKAVLYLVAGPLIEEVEVVLASAMHIDGKWQIDLVRPQSFPSDGLYQSVDINASVTSDLLTPGELPMRSLPSTAITVDMNNVPNDPIVLAQLTDGGAIGKGEEVAYAVQAPTDAQPELWASDDYKIVFKVSWLTASTWVDPATGETQINTLPSHQIIEKAIASGQTADIVLTRAELLAIAGISLGSRVDIAAKAQNIHGATPYGSLASVSMVAPAAEGASLAEPTFEITKFHSSSVKGIMESSVELRGLANVKVVADFPSASPQMFTLVESATGRELESIGNMGVFEGAKSDKLAVADFIPALAVYESDQIAISEGNQSTLPIALDLWQESKIVSLLIDNVGGYSHLEDASTSIEVINQFPEISRTSAGGQSFGIPTVKFITDADSVVAFGAANPFKLMMAKINDDSIHSQYPNDFGKYLLADLGWQADATGDEYGVVSREDMSAHLENMTGKISMISDPALTQTIFASNWGIGHVMNSVRLPQMTVTSDLGSASLTRDTTVAADGSLPYLGAFSAYETDFNLALRPEEAMSGVAISSGDQTVSVSYSTTGELFKSTFVRYEALFEGLNASGGVVYTHVATSADREEATLSQALSQVENGYRWRASVKTVVQHKVAPSDAVAAQQETTPSISDFTVPRGDVIINAVTVSGHTLTASIAANGNSFLQLQGLLLDKTPSSDDNIHWSSGSVTNAHNPYDLSVSKTISNASLSDGIQFYVATVFRGEAADSLTLNGLRTDAPYSPHPFDIEGIYDVPESQRAYSPLNYPAENVNNPHLTWAFRLSTMTSNGYAPFRPSSENLTAQLYWVQMKTSAYDDLPISVSGVVTAGSGGSDGRYNSTVVIKYSTTGTSDSDFSYVGGGDGIFDANSDTTTQRDIYFSTPVIAKYIRVYPTSDPGALRAALILSA